MSKTWKLLAIAAAWLCLFGCGDDESSLYHLIRNESAATLSFRFTNVPELQDSVFVIPPATTDTLIAYTLPEEIVLFPNCGLGDATQVTVQGGRTLLKDPDLPNNWETRVDQNAGISSCTFVVMEEDIQ